MGRVAPHQRDNKASAPVGAPPAPRSGRDAKGQKETRAQKRAAGTKKTALFDMVDEMTANGSCASRVVWRDQLGRDAMVSAYQLPVSPQPATVYTDRFLPPPAERMPPKGMN